MRNEKGQWIEGSKLPIYNTLNNVKDALQIVLEQLAEDTQQKATALATVFKLAVDEQNKKVNEKVN